MSSARSGSASAASRPRRRARAILAAPLEPGDLQLLRFAAVQRIFAPGHAQAVLGAATPATAEESLARLDQAGLIDAHQVFCAEPPAYTITRTGLRLLGQAGAAPRLDLSVYAHDLGAAWLWLAARRGRWGQVRAVVAERELRAQHVLRRSSPAEAEAEAGSATASLPPGPVALSGSGPAGRPRLHYPDLALVLEGGRRVAVELELSAKGPARLAAILQGFAASRYDAVLYLVDRPAVGEAVQRAARAAGIAGWVHVQPFAWGGPVPGRGAAARVPERLRAGERVAGSEPALEHESVR